jgi:hypothetical protein
MRRRKLNVDHGWLEQWGTGWNTALNGAERLNGAMRLNFLNHSLPSEIIYGQPD